MKRPLQILVAILAFSLMVSLARGGDPVPTRAAPQAAPRFSYIDIHLDPGTQPLAAYQIEVTVSSNTRILSLEGGDHAAFKPAPFYDPAALNQNRIIIAAYNTGDDLPTSRTRVVRLHLQISDAINSQVKLIVAGSPDARPINAAVMFTEGEAR